MIQRPPINRIIINDSYNSGALKFLKNLFEDCHFTDIKLKEHQNNVCGAIQELHFAKERYHEVLKRLLKKNTTPELEHYAPEFKKTSQKETDPRFLYELHISELSMHYKLFLRSK